MSDILLTTAFVIASFVVLATIFDICTYKLTNRFGEDIIFRWIIILWFVMTVCFISGFALQ